MAVDFTALAAALLARSPVIVQEWLPGGKFDGDEYHAARKAAGGPGDSLTVNVRTGCWQHFATGKSGGDLTSLYAYLESVSQPDAARELAEDIHFDLEPQPRKANGANGHAPALAAPSATRAPADAPPIPDHPKHGAAARSWAYRDAQGVLYHTARYDTADGKQFCYFTWADGRWKLKAPGKPRPIYGLDRLAGAPANAPVLIVEGEKCADAAAIALPAYVSITWAGGAGAVDTADWAPLKARKVYLWPDADGPGREAMAKLSSRLLALGCAVSAINPEDAPEGWDVADAAADGWTTERIAQWVKPRLKSVIAAVNAPRGTKLGRPRGGAAPVDAEAAPSGSALSKWQQFGLHCNNSGIPFPMEANVVLTLSQHPRTSGKIWFDSFRQEVYHTLEGAERPWTDTDSRSALLWLQQELQFFRFSKRHVDEGVLMYATLHSRNTVHQFVESEPWDGTPRIDEWLPDFLGCPNDPHHRAAGRNWMISMIARAYSPGCQMDHMLILEGEQRKGKSSVLRALAQPWYATLSQRFGSKEFTEAIQGQWLIELADLQALAGARHAQILAEITNRSDRYRAPWDRLASSHDRRCVFAGSTEKHNDYLADTYGIGRFWSIRCDGDINVEALAAIRQQLFAEALVQFQAHEPYHLMPEQTRSEQLSRVEVDAYIERVEQYLAGKSETTALEVFEAVFIHRDDFGRMIGRTIMDSRDEKRIAKILRLIGWLRTEAKREGKKRNLWFAPTHANLI